MPEYELTPRRGSRVTLDKTFYSRVARAYRAAVADGYNPVAELSEQADVSRNTMARWITGARKCGALPPTTPGKVGAGW